MRETLDGDDRLYRHDHYFDDLLTERIEVARRRYGQLHGNDAAVALTKLRADRLIDGVEHCWSCEGTGRHVSRVSRQFHSIGHGMRSFPVELGEGSGHYIDEFDLVTTECESCRGVGVVPDWVEVECG